MNIKDDVTKSKRIEKYSSNVALAATISLLAIHLVEIYTALLPGYIFNWVYFGLFILFISLGARHYFKVHGTAKNDISRTDANNP